MRSRRTRATSARVLLFVLLASLLAASCTQVMVDETVLSSDAANGRDNGTPGSAFAQKYLITSLKSFAVGLDSSRTGDDAFKQPFTGGTNILALIPGKELPDEYVMIGGHYDHLGTTCRTANPADQICNGATDNAAGTTAVLALGRKIAAYGPPRRSVILALWDREEDGLLGSRFYTQNPLVPLAKTITYINFDIQGANLLPSLRNTSFAVGAESGGARLTSLVNNAIGNGTLRTRLVSSIFGQGRSDYVNFTSVQVPNVFFSDSTGPCYHTAQDEVGVVDFKKLDLQVGIAYRLAMSLIQGDGRPAFSTAAQVATFDDAVALREVTLQAMADLGRFTSDQQHQLMTFRDDLNRIVAAGAANFGAASIANLLAGAALSVQILSTGVCDGFNR